MRVADGIGEWRNRVPERGTGMGSAAETERIRGGFRCARRMDRIRILVVSSVACDGLDAVRAYAVPRVRGRLHARPRRIACGGAWPAAGVPHDRGRGGDVRRGRHRGAWGGCALLSVVAGAWAGSAVGAR